MKSKMTYKKNNKILIFFGSFATVLIVPTLISIFFSGFSVFQSWERYLSNIIFGVSYGLAFWFGNWGVGRLTGKNLNWAKNPQRANFISLFSFIIYGIAASLLVPYLLLKYFHHKSGPDFINSVVINGFMAFSVDMLVLSIFYSRNLVHYWKKSIEKAEKHEKETLKAEYEALKSQVNPHFLFNSLNTLMGVVEQEPEKAVGYIKKLSNTYRYVLDQHKMELVSVRDELYFVNDYIFLAKIRHGEGIQFSTKIQSFDKHILPLSLQLLIENCIKHNIISDDLPLKIEISEENDFLMVTNNLQPKKVIAANAPIGLMNLKNRYDFVTEKKVEIIKSQEYFTVKIPFLNTLPK